LIDADEALRLGLVNRVVPPDQLQAATSDDEESGELTFGASVPEGAEVQLTEANREPILQDLDSQIKQMSDSYGEIPPGVALIFSCGIRKTILGSRATEEREIIRSYLGDKPFLGFYSYGEIAPLKEKEKSFLHHCTIGTLFIEAKDLRFDGVTNSSHSVENSFSPDTLHSISKNDLIQKVEMLQHKLKREHFKRLILEDAREQNLSLMTTINQEVRSLYTALEKEKSKTDELLLNILPDDVAEELKKSGKVKPIRYESVSVLFTDSKGFTAIASKLSPEQLVEELDFYFSKFDAIIDQYGLEKLKTIGDAYMCAGGLPVASNSHALDVVKAAMDMQKLMVRINEENLQKNKQTWELRIGINTGPILAGVIGQRKFAYDIWGDTVNIASRMESNGEPGRVNISQSTYELVQQEFVCEHRGKIMAKNKGEIDMYFVEGNR
ncbi:MAG: adenylate/guanylate cyclase domain-containing protein, partial [Spirochaetota bacterium]